MALDGKQRRYLRALGHALSPVLQIGRGGVTPALVRELERALFHHELVKVRVGREAPAELRATAAEVAAATCSELAQVLGRTLLLYRRRAKEPAIQLPGARPVARGKPRIAGASKRLPSTRAPARAPRPAKPAPAPRAGARWRDRRGAARAPADEDEHR